MKLISHTEDLSIVTYSLYEVAPKIYAVQVSSDYDRAMLFLRAQEYYESPFSEFRGRNFNLFVYMNHYRKHKNRDYFSYTFDWCGYNVPSDEIEGCYNQLSYETDMITPYDEHMMHILWQIRQHQKKGKFYLLGVDSVDSSWIMNHEMAHAQFFTNADYKKEMLENISALPINLHASLVSVILQMGYPEKVVTDEIQAYLSTGAAEEMKGLRGIKTWEKKFSKTFKKYNGKLINKDRTKLKATEDVNG
jgi:hypothetical protein